MALPPVNIKEAVETGVVSSNPDHVQDQQLVLLFIDLKGGPSRPIDLVVIPRSPEEFDRVRRKLPEGFFEPFNRLRRLASLSEIQVLPDLDAINEWNRKDCASRMMNEVVSLLDNGPSPLLVPLLVEVFLNLERERIPIPEEMPEILAISIPGSRTYDRAAEAYRAYILTKGNAFLVTSGKAPYYDPNQSGVEITESEANAHYLRLLGVPPNKIFTEAQAGDTGENADFLAQIVGRLSAQKGIRKPKILLSTSPFHIARYRFNVELRMEENGIDADVYAVGSRASRYWAENYFLTDSKTAYTREQTMQVVFNEYLKIAFDTCAQLRPKDVKPNPADKS